MGNCLCVKKEEYLLLNDSPQKKSINKQPQSQYNAQKVQNLLQKSFNSDQQLNDSIEIFLKNLQKNTKIQYLQNETQNNQQMLAELDESEESDTELIQDKNIESKLNDYEKELKDWVLDSSDFKKQNLIKNEYDHIFASSISNSKAYQASSEKSKRLNMEIKLLSQQLPVNKTNSIFVRYDESRMDVMKAAIIGADDTPYANGVFIFDTFFDDTYPDLPPKMQLATTANNTIRFNPNLYANGYICLSILGTWPGGPEEKWNKERSNYLQILLSIQSMVMSSDVYFNEPGYIGDKHTENGKKYNKAYSNIVKYANVKYAMIEQLKNPPKGFEDIIKKHFFYKQKEILNTCYQWLQEAENDDITKYSSLVETHNRTHCKRFSKHKKAYFKSLKKQIKILQKLLDELRI